MKILTCKSCGNPLHRANEYQHGCYECQCCKSITILESEVKHIYHHSVEPVKEKKWVNKNMPACKEEVVELVAINLRLQGINPEKEGIFYE